MVVTGDLEEVFGYAEFAYWMLVGMNDDEGYLDTWYEMASLLEYLCCLYHFDVVVWRRVEL